MEIAIARKLEVTTKPEILEGYWHKEILGLGSANLAKEMGVHPTGLSRDKIRIVKMASRMVCELGLPEGCVAAHGCEEPLTLTPEEVRTLKAIADAIKNSPLLVAKNSDATDIGSVASCVNRSGYLGIFKAV